MVESLIQEYVLQLPVPRVAGASNSCAVATSERLASSSSGTSMSEMETPREDLFTKQNTQCWQNCGFINTLKCTEQL